MKAHARAGAMMLLCLVGFAVSAIIKSGDVLEIEVVGRPEFSGRFTVNENGTIDYPLLADEPVVNISTSELMNHLTFRLAKNIDNPLVLVSVVEEPEVTVSVLGLVQKPGPVETYDGATLQEVLAAAGGLQEQADMTNIKVVPKDGGDGRAKTFNLKEFMQSGSVDGLPRVHGGEIIVAPAKQRTAKVKVIGGVRSPGFFDLESNLNLFEVIYMAGGPAEKADLSRVRRFFRVDGESMEQVVDVQSYIDQGRMGELPLVSEGDVIIVYTKWFDWRTLMTILNNALLFIVTLQTFSGIFDR